MRPVHVMSAAGGRRAAGAVAAALLAGMLLPGCSRGPQSPAPAPAAAPAQETRPALPFIENDYARALAEARQRKVPLFVELWAPW